MARLARHSSARLEMQHLPGARCYATGWSLPLDATMRLAEKLKEISREETPDYRSFGTDWN
jgi:hypothetical protein